MLGAIIGAFESLSDRRCRQMAIEKDPERRFGCLWQRNYHDRIIVDDDDLDRIREYICGNVRTWRKDANCVPSHLDREIPTSCSTWPGIRSATSRQVSMSIPSQPRTRPPGQEGEVSSHR